MSVEIPKRGTRGASLPSVPAPLKGVLLWLYEQVQRHRGVPLVRLTTIGARSGEQRTVTLRVLVDGPGRWLVVASLGGAARNPAWLHNLRAHPDRVTLNLGTEEFPVTAVTLTPAEREQTWPRIVREVPGFADYQKNTDRVIPVVRLTRTTRSSPTV